MGRSPIRRIPFSCAQFFNLCHWRKKRNWEKRWNPKESACCSFAQASAEGLCFLNSSGHSVQDFFSKTSRSAENRAKSSSHSEWCCQNSSKSYFNELPGSCSKLCHASFSKSCFHPRIMETSTRSSEKSGRPSSLS